MINDGKEGGPNACVLPTSNTFNALKEKMRAIIVIRPGLEGVQGVLSGRPSNFTDLKQKIMSNIHPHLNK